MYCTVYIFTRGKEGKKEGRKEGSQRIANTKHYWKSATKGAAEKEAKHSSY